jgi:pimeloyl-ACP methyl ester carboxylesterase
MSQPPLRLRTTYRVWTRIGTRRNCGELCVKEFSESVFIDDLEKFEVPTLIIHGEHERIVPVGDSARLSA